MKSKIFVISFEVDWTIDSFIGEKSGFKAFGLFHLIPIILFALFTYYWITIAKKWPEKKQFSSALFFSLLIAASVLIWIMIKSVSGRFDPKIDLPFHLCNLLALVFPLAIYYKKRWFFGILYFFVLVGTFQATITPELQEPFPHYIYFRYWLLHCGLISLVLYGLYVLKWRVYASDIYKSIIGANIYLVFSLCINIIFDSNYFYSLEKPKTASLLDFLGPWPWYLLTGQLVMIGFFIVYYLPIHLKNKNKLKSEATNSTL